MKLELTKDEIETVLTNFAHERMGQPFNQVTFYYVIDPDINARALLSSATIEWTTPAPKAPK